MKESSILPILISSLGSAIVLPHFSHFDVSNGSYIAVITLKLQAVIVYLICLEQCTEVSTYYSWNKRRLDVY